MFVCAPYVYVRGVYTRAVFMGTACTAGSQASTSQTVNVFIGARYAQARGIYMRAVFIGVRCLYARGIYWRAVFVCGRYS